MFCSKDGRADFKANFLQLMLKRMGSTRTSRRDDNHVVPLACPLYEAVTLLRQESCPRLPKSQHHTWLNPSTLGL